MTPMFKTYAGAAALAILTGFAVRLWPVWALVPASGLICLAAWRLFYYKKPAPKNPSHWLPNGQPLPGTVEWAEIMYQNGLISQEELFGYYDKVYKEHQQRANRPV